MIKENFVGIFSDLEKQFKVYYQPDRLEKFYSFIKHLTERDLEYAIGDIIDNTNKAPTIGAIRTALQTKANRAFKDKMKNDISEAKKRGSCNRCDGSGMILAKRIVGPKWEADYAFACNCDVGKTINFNYPLWPEDGYLIIDDKKEEFIITSQPAAIRKFNLKNLETVSKAASMIGVEKKEFEKWKKTPEYLT